MLLNVLLCAPSNPHSKLKIPKPCSKPSPYHSVFLPINSTLYAESPSGHAKLSLGAEAPSPRAAVGREWGMDTPTSPAWPAGVLRSGLYPLVQSLQGTIMLCTFRRVCGGQGVVFSPAGSLQCCSMSVQNHTALKSASATTNIIPEHWKNSNSDFIKLH